MVHVCQGEHGNSDVNRAGARAKLVERGREAWCSARDIDAGREDLGSMEVLLTHEQVQVATGAASERVTVGGDRKCGTAEPKRLDSFRCEQSIRFDECAQLRFGTAACDADRICGAHEEPRIDVVSGSHCDGERELHALFASAQPQRVRVTPVQELWQSLKVTFTIKVNCGE